MTLAEFIRAIMKKGAIQERPEDTAILDTDVFKNALPDYLGSGLAAKVYGYHEAIGNPNIRKKLFAERNTDMETRLRNALDGMGLEYEKLRGDQNVTSFPDFLASIPGTLGKHFEEKFKNSNDPDKSGSRVKELEAALKAATDSAAAQKAKFDADLHEMKIGHHLLAKIRGHKLRDEFAPIMDTVVQGISTNVRKVAGLRFDDNGTLIAHHPGDEKASVLDPKTNAVLTLDKIVEREVGQFVKKSEDGKPNPDNKRKHDQQQRWRPTRN
ncbi:MAG: hypothetical protein AAF570_17745 [Bacteroidota bacterium]